MVGRFLSYENCQGHPGKQLKCKNSSLVIVIYSAVYGRTEEGRTLCPYQPNIETDEKDDSSPAALKCEKNVSETVKSLCNKKKKCSLKVDQEHFGNPCKGVYKYLKIIYKCGKPLEFRLIFI